MNNIEQSIDNYLSNKNTDYAILINGTWGIGKTYFIKNKFKIQKKQEYESIYISLSNVKIPQNIIALLTAEMFPPNVNQLVTNANALFDSLSNSGSNRISFVGKTAATLSDVLFKKELSKKIRESKDSLVILLDDLERFCGDFHLLFSTIHETLIDLGVHVIYIANEQMIKEKIYKEIKEKYIRYSFEFEEVPEQTLKSVVETHTEESGNFRTFFFAESNDNIDFIISWMEKTGITNLRSFMVSIDCYEYITNLVNIHENEQRRYLFVSILAHADYYKAKFSNIDHQDKTFSNHLNSRGLKADERYYPTFFIFFKDFYTIVKTEGIFEFMSKGFVADANAFKLKLENYYSIENEYEKAVSYLDFTLEDNEIRDTSKKIEEGLKQKKIKYSKLLELANVFEVIEERDGCEIIAFDYKEAIKSAILDDCYPGKKVYLDSEHNLNITDQDNTGFYNEMEQLLITEKTKIKNKSEKEKIETILQNANRTNSFSNIQADNFFVGIIKYDFWYYVKQLNKSSLYYLFEDIIKDLSNNSEVREAMASVRNNFREYLDSEPDMPISRKNQIKRILSLLDGKLKHTEP